MTAIKVSPLPEGLLIFLRFFRLFKIVPFTSIKKWYEKYTHVVLTVRDVTFFDASCAK